MSGRIAVVLYVVAMAAVIAGIDFAFFRNRFWERLTVNVGLVLVFAAFYAGARVFGVWRSSLTDADYRFHVSRMNSGQYGHPGMK